MILPLNDFGLIMDNDAKRYPENQLFAAGDVRANENCLLTVFQTLFLREHNRLVNQFKKSNPKWDSEKLYQEARRWNIAYIQSIIFGEYVPVTVNYFFFIFLFINYYYYIIIVIIIINIINII